MSYQKNVRFLCRVWYGLKVSLSGVDVYYYRVSAIEKIPCSFDIGFTSSMTNSSSFGLSSGAKLLLLNSSVNTINQSINQKLVIQFGRFLKQFLLHLMWEIEIDIIQEVIQSIQVYFVQWFFSK